MCHACAHVPHAPCSASSEMQPQRPKGLCIPATPTSVMSRSLCFMRPFTCCADGATLTIRDAALTNPVALDANSTQQSFGQLLALPSLFGPLPSTVQLRMQRVRVYVECDLLHLMDQLSCSNSDFQAIRANLVRRRSNTIH